VLGYMGSLRACAVPAPVAGRDRRVWNISYGRLQEPGLRARVERRLALLRAERQEIERDMRAIVDGDPRKKALFACQNEAEIHQKAGEDFGFLLQALPAGSLKVT
jgi:hypothetical protein